ncbi:MAG: 6-phosphofructokinase, partial [Chloroflexi bacterium]|nr:6-phosphofructokinase [Chloroflexota bacterium]
PVDRDEAYQAGGEAVRAALRGETGKMVAFVRQPGPVYTVDMTLVPLEEVANRERHLPDEYINAEGNGVTPAFLDYARPLIGGPLPPYARLSKYMVPKR